MYNTHRMINARIVTSGEELGVRGSIYARRIKKRKGVQIVKFILFLLCSKVPAVLLAC
jgi:hypothetical protein